MLSKKEIEKVNKILSCDNCPASYACEGCDITWTDKNLIKKYIDEMKGYLERISKQLDNIAIDQIPIAIKELQQENKTLTHTNKSYKGIINKQNKIIDEMAGYIATLDIDEDICSKTQNKHCDKMSFGECESCIKQYFEKKVDEK